MLQDDLIKAKNEIDLARNSSSNSTEILKKYKSEIKILESNLATTNAKL